MQEKSGLTEYRLQTLAGDASARRYSRVHLKNRTLILMDAPPEQEDCRQFLRVNEKLRQARLCVPKILVSDPAQGFLLLSDLGDTPYLHRLNAGNADELYGDALAAVRHMQCTISTDALPNFDATTLQQELALFTEWFLDAYLQLGAASVLRQQLDTVFSLLTINALEQPQVFVHRDYHSRNLIYRPEKSNPGILDHQDAVCGPATYDIVSLLRDCYICWPTQQVHAWLHEHVRALPPALSALPMPQWQRWFDLMGVQRHLKASGIFARLWKRDGKARYLADIPRTLQYITTLENDYPEIKTLCRILNESAIPKLGRMDTKRHRPPAPRHGARPKSGSTRY